MKLGSLNIASTVKKNAGNIGLAAGLFSDGISPVMDSIGNLPNVHMPDFSLVLSDVTGALQTPVTAYLLSYIIGDINLPFVGKIGKPLQDAAVNYIVGKAGLALLYRSTHSSGGSYAPSVVKNFGNAPYAYEYSQ